MSAKPTSRTERLSISVSAAAAVTCAAIMIVLMVQTNRTRAQLVTDGVLEFNYVQQVDHNFDTFANAALALRIDRAKGADPDTPLPGSSNLLRRFDILYSLVPLLDEHWAGSLRDQEDMDQTISDITAFVATHQDAVVAGAVLSDEQLETLATESQALATAVYEHGLVMFQQKSAHRDEISARMDWLTQASWFFGITFLLAGLTLYFLLTRASRRAAVLTREARTSQQQLQTALEEVTSGDIKRKSQNRFLAAATHDLRQPLQALQWYLTALDVHVTSERGREILFDISRSTVSAQNLLKGLLHISTLDAGVLKPEPESTDLQAMLELLFIDYNAEAEARGLSLSINCADVWVHTDPQFLERILRNLIGNALSYTSVGGVTVNVLTRADGTTAIDVADTGSGIPEEELETIFNEYYQLESSKSEVSQQEPGSSEGMGLGLSIVRRLTRLLDAPLHVSSTVGLGSRFSLVLPTAQPAINAPSERVARLPASTDRLDGLNFLIIDDDLSVRDGMEMVLEQSGCVVLAASGPDEARDMVINTGSVPDLILADYQLANGATGYDVIELVSDEVNEDIPAILITGDTSPERLGEARSRGLLLLHKPVTKDSLFTAIRSSLQPAPTQTAVGTSR